MSEVPTRTGAPRAMVAPLGPVSRSSSPLIVAGSMVLPLVAWKRISR